MTQAFAQMGIMQTNWSRIGRTHTYMPHLALPQFSPSDLRCDRGGTAGQHPYTREAKNLHHDVFKSPPAFLPRSAFMFFAETKEFTGNSPDLHRAAHIVIQVLTGQSFRGNNSQGKQKPKEVHVCFIMQMWVTVHGLLRTVGRQQVQTTK